MKLLAVMSIVGALLLGASGLAIAVIGADRAAKTALDARETITELRTLIVHDAKINVASNEKRAAILNAIKAEVAYDHSVTRAGQKRLAVIVSEVEHHLDHTIITAISAEAKHILATEHP